VNQNSTPFDPSESPYPNGSDTKDFFTVGIGASAGGIKALKTFFQHVPADSGMAYVVILHLSPEHESHLAHILQTSTPLPVAQVTRKVKVKPDNIYVIPPNKTLTMVDGSLELSDVLDMETRRAPVDIFFRTLAETHESRAIGVILSGTGANGSMGIKRLKENGGLIFVQDPREAEYSDMPRNSIATELVDDVLPVAKIPEKILSFIKNSSKLNIRPETADKDEAFEKSLRDIFTQLRIKTGHDFTNYKRGTVLRRIGRRISLLELESIDDYALLIRDTPEEATALLKDLLISVTNFFRDSSLFETLERDIIPRIVKGKGIIEPVRVWIAGCATGEEAYSLAMLLAEHAFEMDEPPPIQIFATDIDEAAIAFAREGRYTLNDAADVSPERLRRFFVKEGDFYRVRREIREVILFAVHNVVKDPPFSRLDLVSCRNVLIYLNRTAQLRVLRIFHFALNAGAYLFLGSSESVDQASELFAAINKENRIFESRSVITSFSYPIPDVTPSQQIGPLRHRQQNAEISALDRMASVDLHQRLLEQYAPPSVLVNEEYDVVHMSDRAGSYLQIAGGEPSHNLLKIILPELRLELRTALYQATQQQAPVQTHPISIGFDGTAQTVQIDIRPVLRSEDPLRGFILIVFEQVAETGDAEETLPINVPADSIAYRLEEELIQLKTQLRISSEQYEVQNEELKASNEELQAMNEELRSAAEELETSKEELQSVNEELLTVNQELKVKIEEIGQSNNDLQNLINATEIGTVFLDRSFRIKLFTPTAQNIFNLIPADVGRNLSDITSKLKYESLLENVERVLDSLQPFENIVSTDDRDYLMTVLPYRTSEDRISGVVMTFVDVTERRVAANKLTFSEDRVRLLTESFRDYAIISTDEDGIIRGWNLGAEHLFGFSESEALGVSAHLIFTPEDIANEIPEKEMNDARENGRASDERWHIRKDKTRFYVSGIMSPLYDGEILIGYAKIARDLTQQKEIEEELRNAREQLECRVAERTEELAKSNESLRTEITERKRSEEERVGLLRRIVTTQEDERSRIARDLHDHLGQRLTALRLKIASLKEVCGDDEDVCARVDRLGEIASKLDSEVSFLAWELRPAALDDLGLESAVNNYVREWSQHFEILAEFHSTGFDDKRLDPEIEINLYRISQEALNNIFKHAQASHVSVILELRKEKVVLIVEDNGKGFSSKDNIFVPSTGKGLGLIGMRERAALVDGKLEIESDHGKGTTIFALVPALFTAEHEKDE
jgi:two-component system CheB/CheR fusion protein